ncbi:MAG: FtsQ-type POTRA domain-containing protein [Opitutae bacterium]|nr:FtsQ-type POTRA domain-containing protein [Opitutae bacterium]
MSEESTSAVRSGRSWREISQEVTPRAMSSRGRRRQHLAWLKVTVVSALLGGMAWLAYVVVHSWETDRATLAAAVKSEPVRELSLITDGTLTKKWIEGVLALPKNATLMALDLKQLRDKLTAYGQVRVAVVSRSFPDMLVLTLQERTPVARMQVQEGLGQPKQLFVAKDGTVYEGFNYDKQMVATLPWLDGVRLTRAGSGYAPVAGMDAVSALLSTAQLQAPNLYRSWLIVSLARLAERDEIVVKAQDIPEIVFTRREDFYKQVAQLDYVVDMATRLPEAGLQQVNLGLGGQVPVKLTKSPDELAKQPPYSPNFNLSTTQRKGQRDL